MDAPRLRLRTCLVTPMSFPRHRGLAFLILFVATFMPAQAADSLFELSLEELMQVQVTSATLTDETLRSVPSSVTVFTHQQIQSIGIDYLHELINYVPGFEAVRTADSGDEYYHASRGQRNSTTSREVLVLLDGQRLNREFDNIVAVPMIALGNIEKVEFIRGPGSAIYGSNAYLGVINITTSKNRNRVMASAGNHGRTQAQWLASGTLHNLKADLYLNGFREQGDEYSLESMVPPSPYDARDPARGYDLNASVGGQTARLNLTLMERRSEEFYILENSSNRYNEGFNRYAGVQFTDEHVWGPTASSNYQLRFYENAFEPQTELNAVGLGLSNLEQHELGQEIKFHHDWFISDVHSLQAGVEYRHVSIDQAYLNTAVLGPQLLYPDFERDVGGIYSQYQHLFTDDTKLTAGLRYDTYSQTGSALSPRIGLTHQLSDIQTVKLLYGEAFRAPTTNEMEFLSNGLLVGNPDLKPESINTWELVWMGNWQEHSLSATWFHNRIEDGIYRDTSQLPNTFVNSREQDDSQGIEVEYIAQPFERWQVRSSYSHFMGLPASALRQASDLASLIVDYRATAWTLNLSANYAGTRQMLVGSTPQTLDNYWLLNGKWQYLLGKTQTLYLQVKNLLDEAYETPPQGTELTRGIPNRGQEFSLGIDWRY